MRSACGVVSPSRDISGLPALMECPPARLPVSAELYTDPCACSGSPFPLP
jgi:hypothetical protein